MPRREIGTRWDRENRNNINENFRELYDVQDRAIEEATQSIIDSAKLIWLEPVNTYADIATSYPNPEVGHTVFVRDTGKVYRFYDGSWMEIQQIDAGPVNEVDTRLSAEIEENRQEIEQARTKADGTTFPVLRDRLNDVDDKIGILSRKTDWVDVRDFGADPTGISNSTQAIKDALLYAKENKIKKVFVPKGTYLVDPVIVNSDAIIVYEGIQLCGEGYETEFKVDATKINSNNTNWHVIRYQKRSVINNIRLNGSKDQVNRAGLTDVQFFGIISEFGVTDFELKNIWVHDIIGINKESFGVHTTSNSKLGIYRNIKGWNCEGTAIHVSGGREGESMMELMEVYDCEAWGNTWTGISIHGSKKVRVYNPICRQNKAGLNIEYSDEIDVFNPVLFDNDVAGLQTWGITKNARVFSPVIYNNNKLLNSDGAEIRFCSGTWWAGSPRGIVESFELHGGFVKNTHNSPHIYYEEDTSVTEGASVPKQIIINHPQAHKWVYKTNNSGVLYSGLSFPSVPLLKPIQIGKPINFSVTTNTTVTPYTDYDRKSENAVTISANEAYKGIKTGTVLTKGKSYLVKVRVKILSTIQWVLYVEEPSAFTKYHRMYFPRTILDQNQWFEGEMIIKDFPLDSYLALLTTAAGTNSIVLDYLTVYEIENVYSSI